MKKKILFNFNDEQKKTNSQQIDDWYSKKRLLKEPKNKKRPCPPKNKLELWKGTLIKCKDCRKNFQPTYTCQFRCFTCRSKFIKKQIQNFNRDDNSWKKNKR